MTDITWHINFVKKPQNAVTKGEGGGARYFKIAVMQWRTPPFSQYIKLVIWRVLHVIWHLLLLKKTNLLFYQGDQKDRRMNVCLLFFNQNMALTSKQCNSLLNCFGNKYWCEKKTKLILLVQGKVCTYKLTILAISPSVTWDPNILWLPMKLDDSGSVVSVMEEPQEQSGQNKLLAGGKIKRHHRFIWHRGLLYIVDNMPRCCSRHAPDDVFFHCGCHDLNSHL